MTVRWTLAILAVVAGLGYAIGRATAPVRMVSATVEVEKRVEVERTQVETVANVTGTTTQKCEAQVIYRPGGEVVVIHRAEAVDKDRATTKAAVAVERAEKVERETRVVAVTVPEAPGWAVAASAGAGLDLRPRYQVEASRRLVGGLWLTVTVDVPQRAALAGLRWEF